MVAWSPWAAWIMMPTRCPAEAQIMDVSIAWEQDLRELQAAVHLSTLGAGHPASTPSTVMFAICG